LVSVRSIIARADELIAHGLRRADQRARLFSPRGARFYARFVAPSFRGFYRAVAREMVIAVKDSTIAEVLDVGSGPGDLSLEIARQVQSARVTGVDLSATMLAEAERKLAQDDLASRVGFHLADAGALPFADARFDLAVSTFSFHHWESPRQVFSELGRVLRPGGTLLIYDNRAVAYRWREVAGLVTGTPFEGTTITWQPFRAGRLPFAGYVRIVLRRR